MAMRASAQVGGSREVNYQTNDKNAKNDLMRLEAEVKQIKNLMASRDSQIKQRSNLLVRRLPFPHLPPRSALAPMNYEGVADGQLLRVLEHVAR
jgi:hypothetical protein